MKNRAAFEFLAEAAAEVGTCVKLFLCFDRLIAKDRLHRIHAAEQKRIAQVEFDHQWPGCYLRHTSALE